MTQEDVGLAVKSNDVSSRSQLLAEVLLGDVERVARRGAARMRERLASYAELPGDELALGVVSHMRGVLEAIRDGDADPSRAQDIYRASGKSAARGGITGDDLLHGWQIGLEVVRERAREVAEEREIGPVALLEFVEATLGWGDIGMRASAAAYHEAAVRELGRLAEEQAALRRVATMVARASRPEEIFAKVADEVGVLLRAEVTLIHRYEPDGYATVVGISGKPSDVFWRGRQWKTDGRGLAAAVRRTERPVRFDDYATAGASIAAEARKASMRSGIGTPIFVDGGLWGVIVASRPGGDPLPRGAEYDVAEFTVLIATAISSIQARSDLAASRARILNAADAERRRVVRDLHDGAQQRLVVTVMTLEQARSALDDGGDEAAGLVDEALQQAQKATTELRELAHGILPSVLTHGGLRAGLRALASRMSIPVELDISVDRLSDVVEATAYLTVAEALTNVTKHAHAQRATVTARLENHALQLEVSDDGIGGAKPDGTGLIGLSDRLAAVNGALRIENGRGGGTVIAAAIPIR